jgi:hypothetical protein
LTTIKTRRIRRRLSSLLFKWTFLISSFLWNCDCKMSYIQSLYLYFIDFSLWAIFSMLP